MTSNQLRLIHSDIFISVENTCECHGVFKDVLKDFEEATEGQKYLAKEEVETILNQILYRYELTPDVLGD